MTLPKFIITMDGYFRLGMVNQHKHLLKPGDQCIGGGYYTFDFVSNRIIPDRSSYDFGKPKWHLLETLIICFRESMKLGCEGKCCAFIYPR